MEAFWITKRRITFRADHTLLGKNKFISVVTFIKGGSASAQNSPWHSMIQKLTVKRDSLSWILYVCCLAYRIRWKGQLGWYLCDDQFQKSEYLYTVRIPRKLFEGLFSVLATKKNSQRFSISTVFRVTCFFLYSAGNEIIPSYFTIQDAWRRSYLD